MISNILSKKSKTKILQSFISSVHAINSCSAHDWASNPHEYIISSLESGKFFSLFQWRNLQSYWNPAFKHTHEIPIADYKPPFDKDQSKTTIVDDKSLRTAMVKDTIDKKIWFM